MNTLFVVCGPTGIGKTKVAIELAKLLKTEIISADSRQIYKELSIGTAVPSREELTSIPHHFIQSHSIQQKYNASIFEFEVLELLKNYFTYNKNIIMVGGSGLYIDAVCSGIDDLPSINQEVREKWAKIFAEKGITYLTDQLRLIDPDYLARVDIKNHKRLLKALEVFEITGRSYSSFLTDQPKKRSFNICKIGLNMPRPLLYERINKRVNDMITNGLVEEARSLLIYRHLTPLNTVGYKELFTYFDGELSLDAAIEKIKDHSRAYARRQITWFRKDPEIQWFEPSELNAMKAFVKEFL